MFQESGGLLLSKHLMKAVNIIRVMGASIMRLGKATAG